jgi:hypothetical protein
LWARHGLVPRQEIFSTGEQNDVTVIVGSMSDEGSTVYYSMPESPKDEFIAGLQAQYAFLIWNEVTCA